MTKEEIYDTKISPLMTKILGICKKHKIAMLATFSTPSKEVADLECTSALLADDFDPPANLIEALNVIRPPARRPLMVTTRDASGKVVRMDAII